MRVEENVPIGPMTTLGIGGPARCLVTAESEADAIESIRACDARKEPLLVVGGGSNLVVADAGFDGTVLRLSTRGREVTGDHVTVAAGEVWDELVASLVNEGFQGVECLSGIPGLVGAVPMQNVGAYGQDVSETIVNVRTWDRDTLRIVDFDSAACRFAYRSSVFRGSDRHVILAVTFALPRSRESRPVRYTELARSLAITEGGAAPAALVRETVIALRRKKGMVVDPNDRDTASAGSFFTNPILDASSLATLRTMVPVGEKLPEFPEADGRTKVSAAWLIEKAGFTKGFALARGRAAISSKHALALSNRGGATAAELVELARRIRDGVRARFGITLENEPVFVGLTL